MKNFLFNLIQPGRALAYVPVHLLAGKRINLVKHCHFGHKKPRTGTSIAIFHNVVILSGLKWVQYHKNSIQK
jgi:hypothetical protein